MATDSGQKFIRRNRAPRVHITYEDPYDAERLIELPFVMGVMSDLSGNNSAVEKPKVEERKFLEFDMDNFENRMAAIEPGVTMRVDNKLGDESGEKLSVNLKFEKMADFTPAAVARQVPATAKLLEAREQLANLLRYLDGKVAAEDQLKKLLSDPAVDVRAQRAGSSTRYRQRLREVRQEPDHGENKLSATKLRHKPKRLQPTSFGAAEAKLQAAHRAGRNRGRQCDFDSGPRSPEGQHRRQGRRPRHHRGDDRAARSETHGADERNSARGRVPEDRERVARPELSGVQLGNRRQSQDPGHERLEDRAVPESAALSGRTVGPEPAVQAGLRVRVRSARR